MSSRIVRITCRVGFENWTPSLHLDRVSQYYQSFRQYRRTSTKCQVSYLTCFCLSCCLTMWGECLGHDTRDWTLKHTTSLHTVPLLILYHYSASQYPPLSNKLVCYISWLVSRGYNVQVCYFDETFERLTFTNSQTLFIFVNFLNFESKLEDLSIFYSFI